MSLIEGIRRAFWPSGWYTKAVGVGDQRDPEPTEVVTGPVAPPVEIAVVPPYAIDSEGWLTGPNVHRYPSPRHSGIMSPKSGPSQPRGACLHWTATRGGTGISIAKAWRAKPKPGQHVGSAQLIIERDGTIYVTMPFHYRAWHAGSASALSTRLGYRANNSLVGIEIVAVGRVAKRLDNEWRGWAEDKGVGYGPVVPAEETFEWKGKRYHAFTKEQISAVTSITKMLQSHYAMDANEVYDHNEIDPSRKEDCGPWFDDVLGPLLKGKL